MTQAGAIDGGGSATVGANAAGSVSAHVAAGVIKESGTASGSLSTVALAIFHPIFSQHGYTGDPFGIYTATVNFQFGFAAPLDVELESSAQAPCQDNLNPGSASFDLAHSLYWGGISNVTVGGQAVNGFSVSSASGTNNANSLAPVPEPRSAALLAFGLAGLVGLGRRHLRPRRHQRLA